MSDQATDEARPATEPHPGKDESLITQMKGGERQAACKAGDAPVTHEDISCLREVSGPARARTAMLSWVGLSLGQQPNCPIPLLTLFLLFFRDPIGKKRSGKDSFPLC